MQIAYLKAAHSPAALAAIFGLSYSSLSKLIYGPDSAHSYRSFAVPKRSGGSRRIDAPCVELKAIQRELLEAIVAAYRPTPAAHGFVEGRSIVSNASVHEDRRVVVNIDLKDFFPSINFRRVRGLFQAPPFDLQYDVATVVAQLCCFRGSLPQGAPTSPVISNLVCSQLDRELGSLARKAGGSYSRYCDDMTMCFSTEGRAKSIALRTATGVVLSVKGESIIRKNGFTPNYAKLRLARKYERQEITGLTVNEFPNVRRSFVRRIHTVLHCVDVHGVGKTATKHFDIVREEKYGDLNLRLEAKVIGWIAHLKMVRGNGDEIFAKLARRFNASLLSTRKIRYFETVKSLAQLRRAIWLVEVLYEDPVWGDCFSQGTAFILDGAGIVTCAHVVVNQRSRRPFAEICVSRVGSLKRFRAFVASFDEKSDVALLYVEGIDYRTACDVRLVAAQTGVELGQPLKMVGFPAYRDGQGLFFAGTSVASSHGTYVEVSSSITGGISGGPLLDDQFRVVGILWRGVPGGAAKNEAFDVRAAFYLRFGVQDLASVSPLPALAASTSLAPDSNEAASFRKTLKTAIVRLLMR